jgi:hypothetical protein
VSTSPTGDPFGPVYRLLDEILGSHLEMADLIRGYKELLEELEDRLDSDKVRLAQSLPGARYTVGTTFVRENWLKVEAELKQLFPKET